MTDASLIFPARDLPSRTPIAERQKLYKAGQATWPEPLLGTTCRDCVFFDQSFDVIAPKSASKGFGKCRRAAQMQGGRWGVRIEARFMSCAEFAMEDREDV
jgi:hypothetical protein